MRRLLMWISFAALAVPATASVQIFCTKPPVGLTDPNYAFVPTNGNHTDITDGNWAVGTFPSGMPNPVVWPGQLLYVWLKFNGEPNGRRINGLDLDASAGHPSAAWYILDDTAGEVANKRWDGAYTAGAPEFKTAHKVLVAVAAYGLANSIADNAGWLYQGGSSRTYLLGALRYDWTGGYGVYTMSLGTAGISYSGGYSAPTVEFGSIRYVPEPANVAVLALLGLSIRRR